MIATEKTEPNAESPSMCNRTSHRLIRSLGKEAEEKHDALSFLESHKQKFITPDSKSMTKLTIPPKSQLSNSMIWGVYLQKDG